ncbi:hypothetical protein HAX54_040586, partial [Datura stramonium]|nr:hypothetical protein [Datura stramonium]
GGEDWKVFRTDIGNELSSSGLFDKCSLSEKDQRIEEGISGNGSGDDPLCPATDRPVPRWDR